MTTAAERQLKCVCRLNAHDMTYVYSRVAAEAAAGPGGRAGGQGRGHATEEVDYVTDRAFDYEERSEQN